MDWILENTKTFVVLIGCVEASLLFFYASTYFGNRDGRNR